MNMLDRTPDVILQYIMWLIGHSCSICVNKRLFTLHRGVYPLYKHGPVYKHNGPLHMRLMLLNSWKHAGYVTVHYRFGIDYTLKHLIQIQGILSIENGKIVTYPYNGIFRIYKERKGPQLCLELNFEESIFKFDSNKNAIVCNQEI